MAYLQDVMLPLLGWWCTGKQEEEGNGAPDTESVAWLPGSD